MRVFKHYSPVASFVALSASLEGPKNGNKSTQVYPEHPSTRGMGVEVDDLHLSDLINGRTEGNILNSNKRCIAHMKQVFIIQDQTSKFTQILHPLNIRPLQDGYPS